MCGCCVGRGGTRGGDPRLWEESDVVYRQSKRKGLSVGQRTYSRQSGGAKLRHKDSLSDGLCFPLWLLGTLKPRLAFP